MLAALDRVEALDKYTVRFTLKEPYAWFLDILANPHAVCIVAKECVEKFGDLKKPEAVVGTGPWMLDSYRPNVGFTLVRNPTYFVPGLPYIDRVEAFVDEDNASRMAAFIAGKYDLGWEFPGHDQPGGLGADQGHPQAAAAAASRRPSFPSNVMTHLYFRNDKPPFSDVRVRRAMSLAIDRQGHHRRGRRGRRGPEPARCRPRSRSGRSRRTSSARAPSTSSTTRRRRGSSSPRPAYPKGFPATIDFTTYGSQVLVDTAQLVLKNLKDVGIDAKLNTKEYGAYIASTFYGKYESMALGPQTPFLEPDNFLYGQYHPGEIKNHGHVNDPVLADMLVRQRRTMDPAKRREIIYEAQRHIAKQQYYVQLWSGVYVAVWDGALQNYGPNLGYDYGGRLMAAWLDR